MSYEIREMTSGDYGRVYALWEESEGIFLSSVDSLDNIKRLLERNPGLSYVSLQNGELAGAVLCSHDGRVGFLTHLVVAPAHRRKGVGRSLVGRCLYALMSEGISKCTLLIEDENPGAMAFWEKVGLSGRVDLVQMAPSHRVELG